ncbi:MAG: outer membrane beta-barrel protein [Bacteroidales bacterium]|nr:outer membrane beta-barrel protein [Candidatus Physcousia equi]
MKRTLLFFLLYLHVFALLADVVKGRAVDRESGEPLQGVNVSVEAQVIGEYYFTFRLTTDSCGVFSWPINALSRIKMELNYFGYEPLTKQFNCAGGTKDTLHLGDLRMKMSEEMMKELTVKGHAKQFYMKGDTVIFNPEAFNLEEGDRVARLLEKLPGVRISEGKLFFMDKEVHLKMNGMDVADNFLTGQLPAEAVQNIKAYEKKSEQTELTGVNDGQEQQVLDIVIKPGFMDKWYGQTKAAAYASKNYRASANLHWLSNKHPFSIYGRVSDCGSITTDVWDENEWDFDNEKPQRQQFGKISYQHNWKPSFVKTSYNDDWKISFSPRHLDIRQNSGKTTETYLGEQSQSTFSNLRRHSYSHMRELPLSVATNLHTHANGELNLELTGGLTRSLSRTTSDEETTRGNTIGEAERINASTNSSRYLSDASQLSGNAIYFHNWEKTLLNLMAQFRYQKESGEGNTHTDYDFTEQGTSDHLDLTSQNKGNKLTFITDAGLRFQLIPQVSFKVGYWTAQEHEKTNYDYLRNGEVDLSNTYAMRYDHMFNEPRIEFMAEVGRLWLRGWFKVSNKDERFEYHRGRLDTLAHRNKWYTRPMLEAKLKTSKTTELKGMVMWEYNQPNFLDCMDYTDDTDPLHIKMGNPKLKPYSYLRTSMSFTSMFPRGQQLLAVRLNYNRNFDAITDVHIYNPSTGAQLSTKSNTLDYQQWQAKLDYDRALGKYWQMKNTSRFSHSREYGIETRTQEWSSPQRVDLRAGDVFLQTASRIDEDLEFTFSNEGWETKLFGSLTHERRNYATNAIQAQRLWQYQVGAKGEYRWKHWNFGLQGKLLGNAGYLSDMMNRDRFALDASVTWKTLKNRAQLTLMAKDILNQLERVNYISCPTTHQEEWSESFHRYVSLTFTYNFDAKAKSK